MLKKWQSNGILYHLETAEDSKQATDICKQTADALTGLFHD